MRAPGPGRLGDDLLAARVVEMREGGGEREGEGVAHVVRVPSSPDARKYGATCTGTRTSSGSVRADSGSSPPPVRAGPAEPAQVVPAGVCKSLFRNGSWRGSAAQG